MERDEELSRLDAVLAGCRRGAGGAALVSGAVASGKTELLHAFTERAVAAGALYFEAGRHLGDPAGLTEGLLRGLELFVEETGRPGPGVPARPRPGDAGPPAAETARRLHAQLLALAEREPVVVGVDDTHRVPPAALRDLLGVARRLRTAPVMMIFTDTGAAHPGHGVLHEELSRLPGTPLLRMRPLSLDGAFRLFARRLGAERAGRLAARGLAVTGGSPLLLRGLLADQRENGTGAADRLEVGAGFEHAVLDCLGRGDEDARRLAAAVAVLGDAATAPMAAELLGWSEPALAATLDALGRAGLLDGMRFRHPAARAAVLTAMDADERTGLHLRAARQLYRKGARAADVAHHVTAASHWVALEHLAQEGNSGAAGETMTSRAD